ncbi:acetate/propionate family kinase [Tengunoibacter tsumagoiensis]|uniref:Acetate kinase n=1 Tax=Tengunoibacter tsumagoiensis TaxID=2014871 RepID=A0A402A4B4_9CHLR|nr:acetate kinase [Tengunoibacter tsumagoiensis]GCE13960.1 acetate kinase [Tengunoibacter tsumagoiensis]
MKILVLNAGSSSQKCRLYAIDQNPSLEPLTPLWEANADWTKEKGSTEIKIKANGQTEVQKVPAGTRLEITHQMIKTLWNGKTRVISGPEEISVVGHRVVHGGPDYRESVRITPEVQATIERLIPYAPLHNPAALDGMKATEQILGQIPQVAVFDTAFHSTIPQEAAIYPGPYSWYEQGIRRYGFHGTSHLYCSQRSAHILKRDVKTLRIVNCHLGNGCSLAAIRNGQSVDTTMGFTPLEGLMMGSRSGTVDPSILIYLQREHGYSADRLDQVLNKESGVLGISGISGDMRTLEKAVDEGNERAKLALAIYIYRITYFIGAMVASLGGIDVLSFTAGVGENDRLVRSSVCERLGFLDLKIDQSLNEQSLADTDIATPDSRVRVLIVRTEEDWEIARECWQNLHS